MHVQLNHIFFKGEVLIVKLKNPNYMKKIQIKHEKHFFLKAKSDCSDETFYECIGSQGNKNKNMKCSKECSFFSFPKMDSYNISKDPIIYFILWQIKSKGEYKYVLTKI